VTVVTRCDVDGEVLSFPRSVSEKYRDGYLPYFLVTASITSIAFICLFAAIPLFYYTAQLANVFPSMNLIEAGRAERTHHSYIREIMDDVNDDLGMTGACGIKPRLQSSSIDQ